MIKNVFAIHDSKASCHNESFMYRTIPEAIRAFVHAAKNQDTPMGAHPADFTLFHVGTYSLETGLHSQLKDGKVNLGNLLDLSTEEPN